jgi:hypothetical protein
MPSPTKTPTARLVQAVNINRKAVPSLADDDVWRAFLTVNGGGDSTRAMSVDQLRSVLRALERAGAPSAAKRTGGTTGGVKVTQDVLIRSLWCQLWEAGGIDSASERALEAWAKRLTKVDCLAWAKAHQKRILIEALKSWLARTPNDPVSAVRLDVRGDDICTDPVRFCRALWAALVASGAMQFGVLAREDTWLRREGYGVTAWQFLTPEQAWSASGKLSAWLRQKTEKAANHV